MPREATITYDQVAVIADTIKAAGGKPNSRMIRERHGSGSLGTIHNLLRQWEGGNGRPVETNLALPTGLQRAILEFLGQELAQAKAGVEAQLVDAQQEAADIAKENERQAAEIEGLTISVEHLQSEASNREGQLQILETDLSAARSEAARERDAAEAARTELAKAQLRLESMPRLEQDYREALEKLTTTNVMRENAERDLAVMRSKAEAVESQLADQKRHSDDLLARMDADKRRLETELADAHKDLRAGAMEIGKLQGEISALSRAKADTPNAPRPASTKTAKK